MKKKFLILFLAGIISTALALPYIFSLQQEIISKVEVPLWQMAIVAILQAAVLLAIAVFLGLKLSQKTCLPLNFFESKSVFKENWRGFIKIALPLGVAVAVVIKLADIIFFNKLTQLAVVAERIPSGQALLASFYGGVVEELLLRLFLMSLFVWLLGKIVGVKEVIKNKTIMIVAILAAAIIFGLGHLPATATITQITPIVVARAIILNGVGGLVFGWLYWKKGLGYSMVAHFAADIVLLAIFPAVFR